MGSYQAVSDEQLTRLFQQQKQAHGQEPQSSVEQRRNRLDRLVSLVKEHQQQIIHAISEDFGQRATAEIEMAEVFPSLKSLRFARKNLHRWIRTERRSVSIWFKPARNYLVYQPLGVVGIIVPWNYPLYLTMGPLAAAIAAGNRVMVKLSEATPHFSALMARLIGDRFTSDELVVVNGDAQVGQAFSRLPFDHLLFTGSTDVGRHIMRAASESLTPVTLELGGKSPTIVAPDYPLEDAVKKIAAGKWMNAGQTCVAPDYLLVPQGKLEPLISSFQKVVQKFYPDGVARDYGSIINQKQWQRLQALRQEVSQSCRMVELLDGEDDARRLMPPTLIIDPPVSSRLMQEEIFGPLLPIVAYQTIEQAIDYVNARPRPLALYLFSHEQQIISRVIEQTSSGGVTLNDTMLHVAQEDLPFGGVGPSGMGHYHGREGFKTFSKARGVMQQSRISARSLLYPPFTHWQKRLLQWMTRL